MAVSANRLELLQISDAAREKSIDKQVVVAAMEEAIQKAAKSRYGQDNEIKAEIDPKTGETRLHRLRLVVDKIENEATEITLDEAQIRNPAAQTGDLIAEPLPPIDFGRIAAQAAKQVIFQKVRDAEREKQFDEYKDRVGEIVHGTVKRVEYGNVVVDVGRGEAFVRGDVLLPREMFRGAQMAEVEVDTETGKVRVLRLACANDVGHAINPMAVEGPIEGGAQMGLGYALTEELIV